MMQMFPTVMPYFAGWCLTFCHPAKFHSPGGKKESKSNQATQSVQASLVWKLSCPEDLSQEKNGIKEGWETHYGPGKPFPSQLWSCIRNLPPLPEPAVESYQEPASPSHKASWWHRVPSMAAPQHYKVPIKSHYNKTPADSSTSIKSIQYYCK